MNFLSHYYLDRDTSVPLFTAGAATPDLLSIFHPETRLRSSDMPRIYALSVTPDERDFADGLNRHFVADGIFHDSVLFREESHWISQELLRTFPETPPRRRFFIAHVLLELILDKVLIDNNPKLLDRFYADFDSLAPFEGLVRVTERALGLPLENYDHFLEKFLLNRYLYRYTDWEHIRYVLGRIMRRVRVTSGTWISSPRFLQLMQDCQARLDTRHQAFFDEIHSLTGR